MPSVSLDQARAAKAHAMATFSRLGEVVGVGITRIDDGYAIKINLKEPLSPGVPVPDTVDGVPVRVEVVGTISKR